MSDPDAKTPRTSGSERSPRTTGAPPEDPRIAIARGYMQAAERELEEEETSGRRWRRRRSGGTAGLPRLSLEIDGSAAAHLILAILALTAASIACLFCYHLMNVLFVAGRIVALPVGMVTAAASSYVSAGYLGIVETTAHGRTSVEDAMAGGWREWFWTLPSSVGMLALAAFCGWIVSFVAPESRWLVIGVVTFVLYPIVQLSALHNGSPFQPFSIELVRALASRIGAWMLFYAVTGVMAAVVAMAGRLTWATPPYTTLLQMGPIVTVAILFTAGF